VVQPGKALPTPAFCLEGVCGKSHGEKQCTVGADEWVRKAADHGNSNAQLSLGARPGISEAEAWRWITQCVGGAIIIAAVNGADALQWWGKVADQGFADSQLQLGCMHRDGEGMKKDRAVALLWLQKAADQGHTEAITPSELW